MVVGWFTRKIDTGPFEDIIEMKPSIVEAGKGHRHFLRKLPTQRFLIHRWLQRIQNLEINFLNVPSLKTKVWHRILMGTQWALNKAGYFWGGLSYRDPQGLKYKVDSTIWYMEID